MSFMIMIVFAFLQLFILAMHAVTQIKYKLNLNISNSFTKNLVGNRLSCIKLTCRAA